MHYSEHLRLKTDAGIQQESKINGVQALTIKNRRRKPMAKLNLLFIAFKRESPWPTFRCLFVQWLKFVILVQRVLIRGNLNNDAENF